jgi:hypothetical protein
LTGPKKQDALDGFQKIHRKLVTGWQDLIPEAGTDPNTTKGAIERVIESEYVFIARQITDPLCPTCVPEFRSLLVSLAPEPVGGPRHAAWSRAVATCASSWGLPATRPVIARRGSDWKGAVGSVVEVEGVARNFKFGGGLVLEDQSHLYLESRVSTEWPPELYDTRLRVRGIVVKHEGLHNPLVGGIQDDYYTLHETGDVVPATQPAGTRPSG